MKARKTQDNFTHLTEVYLVNLKKMNNQLTIGHLNKSLKSLSLVIKFLIERVKSQSLAKSLSTKNSPSKMNKESKSLFQ